MIEHEYSINKLRERTCHCCTYTQCARAVMLFTNTHACDQILVLCMCMYTILPHQEFSVLLCAIFFAFDRDGSGNVDAYELAAGFSLLCCGNKVPYYRSLYCTSYNTSLSEPLDAVYAVKH
jgi:hypothetical protein